MIEINNLTTTSIDEEFLKKIAQKILKKEKESGLSIAFVNPARMKKLNKKYRRKDRVTDVLSFGSNQKFPSFQKHTELGEVIICLSEVRKNAKQYKSTFERELVQVLIHGILHLLGYDHEKLEKEAKKMEEKQQYYLSQVLK